MAILSHKCPHCMIDGLALNVVAANYVHDQLLGVHLKCPKCNKPSCGLLIKNANWATEPAKMLQGGKDFLDNGWAITAFWPEAPKPLIPEHLPPDVERILKQAESNFPVHGNEEAAGTMYRKALDVGLTTIDPNLKGALKDRITELVKRGTLTVSLGEWANQIRLLGNEAAHEVDQPTREELEALRNFSNLLLQYLFTLPEKVNARKAPATP